MNDNTCFHSMTCFSSYSSYMQLDLGQLQVKNSFRWYGCKDEDPSAVRLDILDAEVPYKSVLSFITLSYIPF